MGVNEGVDRREFLRRAAMVSVATAIAGSTYGRGRGSSALETNKIPPLDASGRVTGITGLPDRLIAVGHDPSGVAVWTYKFGDRSWSQSASDSSFPTETHLAGVAAADGRAYAAGSVSRLLESRTVYRIVGAQDQEGHDAKVKPVVVPIHQTSPAVFSSRDGENWERVLDGIPGIRGGVLSAVAASDGGKRITAVGSEHLEPDVEEGYGLVAVASLDGRVWERVQLKGVAPPRHGDISLLAQMGQKLFLATTGFQSTKLYVRSMIGGSWQQVAGPKVKGPVSYVAAGTVTGSPYLAGVDHLDRARYWQATGSIWRETGPPGHFDPTARLSGMKRIGGSLIAIGSRGSDALLEKVEG